MDNNLIKEKRLHTNFNLSSVNQIKFQGESPVSKFRKQNNFLPDAIKPTKHFNPSQHFNLSTREFESKARKTFYSRYETSSDVRKPDI